MTRPRRVVLGVVALSAAAGLVAAVALEVRPGYVDLLDERAPLQRRYLDLLDELGNVEPLHVVVSSPDEAAAAATVDRLAASIEGWRQDETMPRASVTWRVDPAFFEERAPAYLDAAILERVAGLRGLPEVVADPSVERVLGLARQELAAAAAGGDRDGLDPAVLERLLGLLADAASGGAAPAAQPALGPRDGLDPAGRLRIASGRFVLAVMPDDVTNDYQVMEPLVRAVRASADDAVRAAGAPVQVSLTGAPALVVDEMRAVRRDVALASALSFLLVTILFLRSFDSLWHVLFAASANLCGLALTFGAAWLLVGYLNLFSSIFAAVLAGLGIDFGIHFVSDYEARLRAGQPPPAAVVDSFGSVVPPIALSALTTAAAFAMIGTSAFRGFAQLGVISAVGVLLCLLTAFTLLPSLLAWAGRRADPARASPAWSLPLLRLPVRHARVAALLSLLLLVACGWQAAELRFDHDLMNLQPGGTEAVALQRESGAERLDTHPAISLAPSLDEARARAERFRALPAVAEVRHAGDALPAPDPARAAALARLRAALAPARPDAPQPVSLDAARAEAQALETDLVALQDLAFEGGDAEAVAALDGLLAEAGRLRAGLEAPGALARLEDLRTRWRGLLGRMASRLDDVADGVAPEDLPEALRSLVGRTGRFAILVTPRTSVWDREALERFVADVRTVDPEITGPAVQVEAITELMRVSLVRCSWMALAVIAVLVLLTTRNVITAGLSMLPLLSGFVVMLGFMRTAGVPLNPANLVALPLLVGLGVDGGVHLIHRWRQARSASRAVEEVGHALLITSLTTLAGFLPLLLARHQGIRSLGAATCLGSLAMLLAVTVLMPSFLALLDARRGAATRGAP